LVLALCAAGCGGNNLDGPTQKFAGAWQYITGMATGSLTCGASTIDETPHGNKILATGVDAALVDLTASEIDTDIFCNFRLDVTGPVATVRTDQTCVLTGGNTIIAFNPERKPANPGDPAPQPKDPPDAWTFTLLSETTAEEAARATLIVYQNPTQIGDPVKEVYCDYDMTAHLQRVSKD
jgi:hypothetical protein